MNETITNDRSPGRKTAGARVKGNASVGDLVTYFDIANQDGAVWEVIKVGPTSQDIGGGLSIPINKYTIRSLSTGGTETDNLNAYGWTFGEKDE